MLRNLAHGTFWRHELALPVDGPHTQRWPDASLRQQLALAEPLNPAIAAFDLVTRDLRSGLELLRWPLPREADYGFDERWNGHQLAVALAGGPEYGEDHPAAGVQLVDTRTGECKAAELADVDTYGDAPPRLSEWSRGRILVQRWLPEDTACAVSAVDSLGVVLHTASFSDAQAANQALCWACWSPDGSKVALSLGSGVWVWEPGNGAQPVRSCLLRGNPDSCFCWSGDSRSVVTIVDVSWPAGVHLWTPPHEEQMLDFPGLERPRNVSALVCGSCSSLALLCDVNLLGHAAPDKITETAIFYRLTDAGGFHVVRAPSGSSETVTYSSMDASLDGTLVALAACQSGDVKYKYSIDVLSLRTGHLVLRTAVSGFRPGRVLWAADGASVLVLDDADSYEENCAGSRLLLALA